MSSEDITRAEISGLLQAVARLEAVAQQQQISMTRLADTVDRLVRTQEAQSADVETFWRTGKGAQWDADIKANTAAIRNLSGSLDKLRSDYHISRAQAVGLLGGSAVAGGGIVEAIRAFLTGP
jgi:hypothetical protein